ncbi:hypothetical protein TNCV_769351 [Trichonephila clavipes]|nr:hypothetical protein TNCV_769351 [Trichonephila clavipes]
MQYHGEGRHQDQWPQFSFFGCNGTMTGQSLYIDEVFPHVRLFRGAFGDKFVFGTTKHSNTCSGLSRQRGYSTSRMLSAFSRLNPIENVWDALGYCWSKLSSDKQEHPSVHSRGMG